MRSPSVERKCRHVFIDEGASTNETSLSYAKISQQIKLHEKQIKFENIFKRMIKIGRKVMIHINVSIVLNLQNIHFNYLIFYTISVINSNFKFYCTFIIDNGAYVKI